MTLFVIRSLGIDRTQFDSDTDVDAVCDKDGDPMCWITQDSVVNYYNSLPRNRKYFIDKVESDDFLSCIFDFNRRTKIGLKLNLMP